MTISFKEMLQKAAAERGIVAPPRSRLREIINWLPDRSERWRRQNTWFAAIWLLADVSLIGLGLWKMMIELYIWLWSNA